MQQYTVHVRATYANRTLLDRTLTSTDGLVDRLESLGSGDDGQHHTVWLKLAAHPMMPVRYFVRARNGDWFVLRKDKGFIDALRSEAGCTVLEADGSFPAHCVPSLTCEAAPDTRKMADHFNTNLNPVDPELDPVFETTPMDGVPTTDADGNIVSAPYPPPPLAFARVETASNPSGNVYVVLEALPLRP